MNMDNLVVPESKEMLKNKRMETLLRNTSNLKEFLMAKVETT